MESEKSKNAEKKDIGGDERNAHLISDEYEEELGELADVLERPANNVYVVRGGAGERLIPDVPEFILEKNAEQGRITVHLIEGL